ncbi:LacI family DNA-binding transcriptional regulator [Streptomyces sp. V3I7]|uniref:LacI family DNA-binding transcriptional regulator n=1 Tax=Streptomyces sp. V3I7 TaxID=3042278 RepID=UPI0027801C69|nr:LacI family DNA-binding transcriptional regulator [Streptomyces sp. V3I7]MDQ0988875.1 LacI family transcriptional regulator [Streptomyces sp. V3I7]
MATIYEVAALAGVSPATVSRVLNGAPVGQPYADKVRKAAATLNYKPNRTARTLRRRSAEVIALIIPDIENPFFTALARGVEDRAQAEGYSVVLCNTDDRHDKEAKYLEIALSEHMAGVILAPASDRTSLDTVTARKTPVVVVDRTAHHNDVDAVVVDNAAGGRTAATALYEQGFSLVACITGPSDVETAEQRAAGWREVFTARTPEAIPDDYLRFADYRVDGGFAAMADLMRLPEPPDAVFVANNLMSLGALHCLAELDQAPPAIGMVAFGDLPLGIPAPAGVSVIHHPAREIGVVAARLLIERIAGDTQPSRTVVLPTSLD